MASQTASEDPHKNERELALRFVQNFVNTIGHNDPKYVENCIKLLSIRHSVDRVVKFQYDAERSTREGIQWATRIVEVSGFNEAIPRVNLILRIAKYFETLQKVAHEQFRNEDQEDVNRYGLTCWYWIQKMEYHFFGAARHTLRREAMTIQQQSAVGQPAASISSTDITKERQILDKSHMQKLPATNDLKSVLDSQVGGENEVTTGVSGSEALHQRLTRNDPEELQKYLSTHQEIVMQSFTPNSITPRFDSNRKAVATLQHSGTTIPNTPPTGFACNSPNELLTKEKFPEMKPSAQQTAGNISFSRTLQSNIARPNMDLGQGMPELNHPQAILKSFGLPPSLLAPSMASLGVPTPVEREKMSSRLGQRSGQNDSHSSTDSQNPRSSRPPSPSGSTASIPIIAPEGKNMARGLEYSTLGNASGSPALKPARQVAELSDGMIGASGSTNASGTIVRPRLFREDEVLSNHAHETRRKAVPKGKGQLDEAIRLKRARRSQRKKFIAGQKRPESSDDKDIVYASDEAGFDYTTFGEHAPPGWTASTKRSRSYTPSKDTSRTAKKAKLNTTASSLSQPVPDRVTSLPGRLRTEEEIHEKTKSLASSTTGSQSNDLRLEITTGKPKNNGETQNHGTGIGDDRSAGLQPNIPQTLAYNSSLHRQESSHTPHNDITTQVNVPASNSHLQKETHNLPAGLQKLVDGPLPTQLVQDPAVKDAFQSMVNTISTIRGNDLGRKMHTHPDEQRDFDRSTTSGNLQVPLPQSNQNPHYRPEYSMPHSKTSDHQPSPVLANPALSGSRAGTSFLQPPPFSYAGIQPQLHQSRVVPQYQQVPLMTSSFSQESWETPRGASLTSPPVPANPTSSIISQISSSTQDKPNLQKDEGNNVSVDSSSNATSSSDFQRASHTASSYNSTTPQVVLRGCSPPKDSKS